MKLYSNKEIEKAIVYGLKCTKMDSGEIPYVTIVEFLGSLTSIEPPTDAEIESETITKFPIKKRNSIWSYHEEDEVQKNNRKIFIEGVKWAINKIEGQAHQDQAHPSSLN